MTVYFGATQTQVKSRWVQKELRDGICGLKAYSADGPKGGRKLDSGPKTDRFRTFADFERLSFTSRRTRCGTVNSNPLPSAHGPDPGGEWKGGRSRIVSSAGAGDPTGESRHDSHATDPLPLSAQNQMRLKITFSSTSYSGLIIQLHAVGVVFIDHSILDSLQKCFNFF